MTRKTTQVKTESHLLKAPEEDFFGFEGIPLDKKDFTRVQTDIFQKVERALNSMEEDLQDMNREEKELLMSVMKVSAWRNLRECLGASLQNIDREDELEKLLYECASIFYKELDHPYWSTTQFQYLLHINPHHPEYWAGYGICLVKMQERGVWEEFMLEEKAAIAFKRAARLAVAHLLKKTPYMEKISDKKLMEHAQRYYENALALNTEPEAEQGLQLCKRMKKEKELREAKNLKKETEELADVRDEIREILEIQV